MSNRKVYGYVIINSETGEQWGTQVYSGKAGAANSYNQINNNVWNRDNRHKFADQTLWVRKELVLADE